MSENNDLYMLLGEMRTDIKYLVHERKQTNEKLAEVQTQHDAQAVETERRLKSLEGFRMKIGVLATALGVVSPFLANIILKKLGWT